jgi:hypothetical protein
MRLFYLMKMIYSYKIVLKGDAYIFYDYQFGPDL